MHLDYTRTIDTKIDKIKFKKIRVIFKDKSKKFAFRTIKNYRRRNSKLTYMTLIRNFTRQSCRKMSVLLQNMYGAIFSLSGVSRLLNILEKKNGVLNKISLKNRHNVSKFLLCIFSFKTKEASTKRLKILKGEWKHIEPLTFLSLQLG